VVLVVLEVVQVAAQLITLGVVIGLAFKVDRIPMRPVIDRNRRARGD
jgi:hypothetical protein